MYRDYQMWVENGTLERRPATANLLFGHCDRLASHLCSPSDMRFVIDTESPHPRPVMERCERAANVLTREWERNNIDTTYAQGVSEALKFGLVIVKAGVRSVYSGNSRKVDISARLVMPWHFGVLDETRNSLDVQEAVCETTYLTKYEVFRRVRGMPNGETLYKRIIANAMPDPGTGGPDGFMHQVLLGATQAPVNPSAPMQAPGLVDVGGNQYPQPTVWVAEEMFPMHEIWVKDDKRDDWTTIQYIEPDILIAPNPIYTDKNLYAPDTLPYGVISANVVPGRFWGRSEVQDLMEPQKLLTGILDDYRKLMGVQFDKLFGFIGADDITDERMAQMRNAGAFNLPPQSDVKDLTPKIPPEALPFIEWIVGAMEKISGFSNILSGSGEPGVRAGIHAETLMKTASPRLRDRSLLIERQLASFADITLAALEAKEATVYWINPDDGGESDFRFCDLPDDRRVSVDAHSSSPIYHHDMTELMAFGHKAGYITGESMIEFLAYQNKDTLLRRFKEKEKMQAALIEKYPELLTKGKGGKKL